MERKQPLHKLTEELAGLISQTEQILIFTGAGISTESGISDYRSKGGIWDRFQPVSIQEFLRSEEKRKEYWRVKRDLYDALEYAHPNEGHKAIVTIEKMGKLKGIITQNIDGLHAMAGSSPELIIELHGNNRETICLSCGEITTWQATYKRLKAGEEAPLCHACQGYLKPNTISFGQSLDPDNLSRAAQWTDDCGLLMVIGSTLIVEPAASIPRLAQQKGAKLVIITLSSTPYDDVADLKIEAGAGQSLKDAIDLLSKSDYE